MKRSYSAVFAVALTTLLLASGPIKGQTTNAQPEVKASAAGNVPATDAFPDGLTSEAIVKKSRDAYAALQSYSDSGTVNSKVGSLTIATTFNIRLQRPNLYRIDWQQNTPMAPSSSGVVWSDGSGDFLKMAGRQEPEKQSSMEMALAGATGISGGAAATTPAEFFRTGWGDQLGGKKQRLTDEKVGDVDCYVLTSTFGKADHKFTTTVWIGKQDNFIHQLNTKSEGSLKIPEEDQITDDASLKKMLAAQGKPATPEAMDALRKQMVAVRKIAEGMLKGGGMDSLETHTNIVTNKTFTAADCKPGAP